MRIVKPAHNGTYGEIAFILYTNESFIYDEGIIKNSSGVWRGDVQEQRGPFEACGQAAYRG